MLFASCPTHPLETFGTKRCGEAATLWRGDQGREAEHRARGDFPQLIANGAVTPRKALRSVVFKSSARVRLFKGPSFYGGASWPELPKSMAHFQSTEVGGVV